MNLSEPLDREQSFFDHDFKRETVRIKPGDYFVTDDDLGISTVLGSCVSACLRDVVTGIGGMNHFMLPFESKFGNPDPLVSKAARYGVHAMELTINEMLRYGARRHNIEAKVFGGAAVIDGFLLMNIGTQNARFVIDFLERESIAIVASDLEGTQPRKVYFHPKSGVAFVKHLGLRDGSEIKQRERRYLAEVSRTRRSEPVIFS
jgi:chemotaxis protein CheD